MKQPIALAALTVLELTPPEQVSVAAQAGYSHVGLRLIPVTAIARTLPCWINGSSVAVVPKFMSTRPPSISVTACAPPR